MPVERWMQLVVEVVEQRHHAPALFVLAVGPRVRRCRRLDSERVSPQRDTLHVLRQGFPGLRAGRLHEGGTIAALMAPTAVADALVESFVIEGGRPLRGHVRASGNKNGALPILAACLLTHEPVELSNVPRIRDVDTMLELLADLGAEVEWQGRNDVRVHASDV